MRYALCLPTDRQALCDDLDRSDLLAHKDIITDAKTEEGDRHNRDQMRDHDDEAL
jgi:hypothetical protein